jgi:hypothetical protein
MDTPLAKQYAQLLALKRKHEDEVNRIKKEMRDIETPLRDEMLDHQVEKFTMTINGERITIYLHKQLWARANDGDKASVVKVLKRCGLSDLVKEDYNTNQLAAWVRERLANGQQLQPTLAEAITLTEDVSVRGRRSPVAQESKTAQAMRTIGGTK